MLTKKQKGFSTIFVIIIIALAVIVGGVLAWQYWPEQVGQQIEQEPSETGQPIVGEIQIGKIEINYDEVSALQEAVDVGHQPWRLEPVMVLEAEGLRYGFIENELSVARQISIALSAGVTEYEVNHNNNNYVITLLQPVPGQGRIWIISKIERQ